MKKLFYILAMTLMVLASVSCTKQKVPGFLKGTVWVYEPNDSDFLGVLVFGSQSSFTAYGIKKSSGEIQTKTTCDVVEIRLDQILFVVSDVFPEDVEFSSHEGLIFLNLDEDEIDVWATADCWTYVYDHTGTLHHRSYDFDISKLN